MADLSIKVKNTDYLRTDYYETSIGASLEITGAMSPYAGSYAYSGVREYAYYNDTQMDIDDIPTLKKTAYRTAYTVAGTLDNYGVYRFLKKYGTSTGGSIYITIKSPSNIKIKTSDGWKDGKAYVKTDTGWKESSGVYVKTESGWKQNS